MKLWIDDVRPAPEGYVWVRSVNDARCVIENRENLAQSCSDQYRVLRGDGKYEMADRIVRCAFNSVIELIDIDHDAGDFATDGGDYIKLLDWLEETGRNYPIRIHSQNVVGRMNMEAICRRNGWTIVK